jgi:nitrogen fixation protein FixH
MHNNNSRKELIMNNRLILFGIMFVLSLLALPLTGCDTDSGMVLVVKVDTPKDGSTVNTPTVMVSGRVVGTESKGAKVSINNIDAPVTDGKYSANVTLKEGKNIINIVAKSGQAAPEEIVNVTYDPAKK